MVRELVNLSSREGNVRRGDKVLRVRMSTFVVMEMGNPEGAGRDESDIDTG